MVLPGAWRLRTPAVVQPRAEPQLPPLLRLRTLARQKHRGNALRQVTDDQPLAEAGMDSLGAVELRGSVLARFGVDLAPTAVFDHPTVAALAGLLAAGLPAPAGGPGAGVQDAAPAHKAVSPQEVLAQLQEVLSALLGARVDADAPLMAAGLDSLAGAELRASVLARFGVDLPATAMFDHPTPVALAAHVAGAAGAARGAGGAGAVRGPRAGAGPAAAPGSGAWASEVAGVACLYPSCGSSAPSSPWTASPTASACMHASQAHWACACCHCTAQKVRPHRPMSRWT